jgi:SAM-dependent methyltransferase
MAKESLRNMLAVEDFEGKTFLDIGTGSGLFSLAARRLGANVCSFDYDPQAVACAKSLKDRFFLNDELWTIETGSALDAEYLQALGQFDYVYSWGVLHHTGDMWRALENVVQCVATNGKLFIAIYNDQGKKSRFWIYVKKTYNKLPHFSRIPFAIAVMIPFEIRYFLRNPRGSIRQWFKPRKRGMNKWYDLLDWVGGYPFEVAKPETISTFFEDRGFQLTKLVTTTSSGNNEFVFQKRRPIIHEVDSVIAPNL